MNHCEYWEKNITKMKNVLNVWKQRDLSMFGKIHIVKSVALSLLQYCCSVIHIHSIYIVKVQSIIWDFVWEWKACHVQRDICALPRYMSDLNLPIFEIKIPNGL